MAVLSLFWFTEMPLRCSATSSLIMLRMFFTLCRECYDYSTSFKLMEFCCLFGVGTLYI
jgi:hypothetical protein